MAINYCDKIIVINYCDKITTAEACPDQLAAGQATPQPVRLHLLWRGPQDQVTNQAHG